MIHKDRADNAIFVRGLQCILQSGLGFYVQFSPINSFARSLCGVVGNGIQKRRLSRSRLTKRNNWPAMKNHLDLPSSFVDIVLYVIVLKQIPVVKFPSATVVPFAWPRVEEVVFRDLLEKQLRDGSHFHNNQQLNEFSENIHHRTRNKE